MLPELKVEPKVVYEDALYHASPQEMLEMLHDVRPGANRVLLVGHNPEIQAFALDLVGSGPKHLRDRLEAKYPTAGLVGDQFHGRRYGRSVTVNSGKLEPVPHAKDLRVLESAPAQSLTARGAASVTPRLC